MTTVKCFELQLPQADHHCSSIPILLFVKSLNFGLE